MKSILSSLGVSWIQKNLPVSRVFGPRLGLLAIALGLMACGDEGGAPEAPRSAPVQQIALSEQDVTNLRNLCVLGQTARIDMGLNFCLDLNIRSDEYCHACEAAEWANVESKFLNIQADAKSQYDLCMVQPTTLAGVFTSDYCKAIYYGVFQQRMSECQNSLYCFNL